MDSFSEYLNKPVNSILPSQQEKSIGEDTSLLKKNLCTKNERIKKLVVTHCKVLNNKSAKSNNQQSNPLNQSNSSLSSNRLNKNSRNTKKLASQEQQHQPIARPSSSQCKKYRIPFKHTIKDPSKILQWKIYM